jgi:hypothetical protein
MKYIYIYIYIYTHAHTYMMLAYRSNRKTGKFSTYIYKKKKKI